MWDRIKRWRSQQPATVEQVKNAEWVGKAVAGFLMSQLYYFEKTGPQWSPEKLKARIATELPMLFFAAFTLRVCHRYGVQSETAHYVVTCHALSHYFGKTRSQELYFKAFDNVMKAIDHDRAGKMSRFVIAFAYGVEAADRFVAGDVQEVDLVRFQDLVINPRRVSLANP